MKQVSAESVLISYYFLLEDGGDSETDYFDIGKGKVVMVDVEDAESCCTDSFDHHEAVLTENGGRGRRMKIRMGVMNKSHSTSFRNNQVDDDDEADSSMVVNVIDHTKTKLKSCVSASLISSSSDVINMDDITDDRLFWEACLAHGYP
uniref:Uncharacterized protein n=1 Tax=Kalanchoe fedtschenkoi TaxID=63787 RepID=A0A7N0UEM7_KALFE